MVDTIYSRLFLFVINFGSHLITFNEAGNVVIRNHVIDRMSSILDLLRACVSVTSESKPTGYNEHVFVKALQQINVPKHFLSGISSHEKRHKKAKTFR